MYERGGVRAFFNPQFEEAEGESWELLVVALSERARRETLEEHVRAIALSVEPASGIDTAPQEGKADAGSWISRLSTYGGFDQRDIQFLLDMSTVATTADQAECDWVVLFEPNDEWSFLRTERWRPYFWPFGLHGP